MLAITLKRTIKTKTAIGGSWRVRAFLRTA
jgi:hypothetical protein